MAGRKVMSLEAPPMDDESLAKLKQSIYEAADVITRQDDPELRPSVVTSSSTTWADATKAPKYWHANIMKERPAPVFAGSYNLPDGKGYWGMLVMNNDQLVDIIPIEVVDGGQYRELRDPDCVLRPVDILEHGVYIFIY